MKTVHSPAAKVDTIGQLTPFPRHKMAQDHGTNVARDATRTKKLCATLPEGISIGIWNDERPSPFYVRFGKPRKVESFSNERKRNDRADELAHAQGLHGTKILDYEATEWAEFQAWKAQQKKVVPAIGEAVTRYLGLRLREDLKEGSDTHLHIKTHLARLAARFQGFRLDIVKKEELREWLEGMKNLKTGKPVSRVTVKNVRKDVNTFFKRCVDEEWIDKNPCSAIKPPKVDPEPKKPLPAKDIFQLLKANRDQPIVGRLALELFGGLRCSSAERIQAEHVKWETKGIAMPGQGHKSGSWKYRQGHPEVLWQWLKHAAPDCFTEIHAGNYDFRKGQAFTRANVTNPGNVLRDSFASYMLASTKSYQLVGYLMQHTRISTTMVYEGTADEADAKLVMAMGPEAVKGTWEEFLAHK